MLHIIFQSNYATFLVCIFLGVFIFLDHSFERRIRLLFLVAISTTLLLIIVDSMDYFIAAGDYSPVRLFTTALGYSLRPFIIYCIICVIHRWKWNYSILLLLPLIINALLCFTSIVTPIVFGFTPGNNFIRGPLGYFTFWVSGFYIVMTIIVTITSSKRNGLKESRVVIGIIISIIIAVIFEMKGNYKFLLDASIAVGLSSYYLYIHIQIYKHDPLTNLLNRRNFYLDANDLASHSFYVIALDIDNLKAINDSGGHSAGDKAILCIVNTIYQLLDSSSSFYRVGGDEFMIICRHTSEVETQNLISQFKTSLIKTGYSVSFGYSLYEPGDVFQQVCEAADHMMYNNKKKEHIK